MSGLHHVHLFASDLSASISWYREMLGGEVAFDGEFGGARNVFMRLGQGRLHLYDQPPRGGGASAGAVHHLGYQSDDLAGLVAELRQKGVALRGDIHEFGFWRYIMCAAPDDVLWELFEFDDEDLPAELAAYFDGD